MTSMMITNTLPPLPTPEQDFGQLQSRFIDTVSHEMRTPLTALKVSLGVLDENLTTEVSPPMRRLLKNAIKSAARLEAAVNDLLDLANLESGKLRLQPLHADLAAAIIEAVELARPLAEERGQTLSVTVPHTPCPAIFDPPRIGQVMLHLLSNAVKYTPVGGEIRVELHPCASDYCVEVCDNGKGVPLAHQATIFQRFYTPADDNGILGVGGGLGLPLARALVELHGGRLCVASTGVAGEGSIFYFNLPRTRADDQYLPTVNLALPLSSPHGGKLVLEQTENRGIGTLSSKVISSQGGTNHDSLL